MSSSISSSRMALCITYLSKEGSDAHLIEGWDSGDKRKSMEDGKLGYITDLLDLQPAYIWGYKPVTKYHTHPSTDNFDSSEIQLTTYV